MKLKQSVCFPMMEPLPSPMPEFLDRVARMGYAAVEVWAPPADFEQLVGLAKQRGLCMASLVGHQSIAQGMNDPSQHERIWAELHQSIDLAARFDVPGIICFSGNRRAGQSEDEAIAACVEGFKRIAPYAEEKGVNLNMELLNSKVDHPGYQADHAAWGLEVVKAVNSPRVKVLYDIYHMQIMDGDLIHTISENIQWIGHFHTAGVPGRHQLDDTQEINYRAVCQAITAAGYELYLGHEFRPTRDLFTTLEEAYALCNAGEAA